MKTVRSGVLGMAAALAVSVIVLGALALGLLEAGPLPVSSPTPRMTLPPPNLTPLPGTFPTPIAATPSVTSAASPTRCPPPAGWLAYTVPPGESLRAIAASRGISLEQIMAGNCLISEMVIPYTRIFLPPLTAEIKETAQLTIVNIAITPLSGTATCHRPTGWIDYTVKAGDNLTRISVAYRIATWYLKQVNCLQSDTIRPGWIVWVPNVPTSTFTASPTATEKSVEAHTSTPTSTQTPTASLTPSPVTTISATPSPTPTSPSLETVTSSPSHTSTATSSSTPSQSDTATSTVTP